MAQKFTYTLVLIGGEGDPLAASTLPLAVALIALGCVPEARAPFVDIIRAPDVEGAELERSHRYIFRNKSACGKYDADDLRKRWLSAAWLADNPTHPLCRIRAAFLAAGVLPLEADPFDTWLDADPADLERFRNARPAAKVQPDPDGLIAKAFELLERARQELAGNVPLLEVRRGRRRALIPIDATPEEEARLLARIEK